MANKPYVAGDFGFVGGTAGATTAVVSGGPTTFTVSVSGMSGQGDVTATIPADSAMDESGNLVGASTSTDNSVTVDTIGKDE